ncbi:restriction endonuclease subunit S [uncultured Sulfitobacter sp.]|uniref:restriction endonuclease subunit S n=1 Tax=uncultured Sulfitobacter sp. TaxID=191468 RepID=UPI00261A1BF4|nr:restriction endonuclease subunit S [uncultured Sulfitobacter sp.]
MREYELTIAELPPKQAWQKVQLADLGFFVKGKGIARADVCDEGLPCLRYGEIYSTYETVTKHLVSKVSPSASEKSRALEQGDIVFAASGETAEEIGKVVTYTGKEKAWVGGDTVVLRGHGQNAVFLAHVLNSDPVVRQKSRLGKGQSVVHIHAPDLASVEVLVPSLAEQHKIAAILLTWDEALEKLNALRAVKARQLDGLSQITMGCGGAFPDHWQRKPLSEVSTPVKRKSAGGDHPVMTISAKSGFLMQADKFARNMAGRSVERYTLLHEGEFAYNKGNSKTAPYGCVFRLDRDDALVPFVYYCFALKPGLDPEFYDHLFSAGALNHQLSRLINSGVRNDGLLNLYSNDFFSCRVPVPPIEEQKRIAQALTTAKRELSLLDEEIAALTGQKRGLMQKLLTGEWRVEVSNNEKATA